MAGIACAATACALPPPTPERADEICSERARNAAGPTGRATVAVNSETGLSTGLRIGVTSDFLAQRDPIEVYRSCFFDLTGTTPVRDPIL